MFYVQHLSCCLQTEQRSENWGCVSFLNSFNRNSTSVFLNDWMGNSCPKQCNVPKINTWSGHYSHSRWAFRGMFMLNLWLCPQWSRHSINFNNIGCKRRTLAILWLTENEILRGFQPLVTSGPFVIGRCPHHALSTCWNMGASHITFSFSKSVPCHHIQGNIS